MATGSEQQHPRDALPVGTELGLYEIESVLGHGGFGIVYKARHLELDSIVAIKELLPLELAVRDGCTVHPRNADCVDAFEEARVRFVDEAKSLVQFRGHPGVVTCLEFFRANGTAYLVMEHEEGRTLSELLLRREAAGRPFDQADLLGIAEPLLEALSGVHEAGLLHRDIKPSNILVRRRDDKPVLIDFGAAKQEAALHSKSLAPATEGYAAVEQVGDGDLGTWTDLYAIGAVLWRMVASGNPPWIPPNPIRVESRLSARVRGGADPLPTARALGSGRFSDSLLDAIDKCLELREHDRVQDCGYLLRQLRASGNDVKNPVSQSADAQSRGAALATTGQRSSAVDWRRRPLVAGLGLSLLVAVLGGGVWFGLDQPLTVSKQADTSQADPSNADSQYKLAKKYDVGDGVTRDLSRAAQLYLSAAERGHADAQYNLGVMYSQGEGVHRDRARAISLYRSAAEQGHADAQLNLGVLEYRDFDFAEASKWLRRAAKQDLPEAQYSLYVALSTKDESSEAEAKEAQEWLRRAAEGGHAGAQWAMYCFSMGQDRVAPLAATARHGVGWNMHGSPIGDEGWLWRAAENGNPAAQMLVGHKYAQGAGVMQDHREAVKWYQRAAESETSAAYAELCSAYFEGKGVLRDADESAKWCLLAANYGFADAQWIMASQFSSGFPVPRDYIQAIKWATLSRRKSPTPFKDQVYSGLVSKASRSEFEAGAELADKWSQKGRDLLDGFFPEERPRR